MKKIFIIICVLVVLSSMSISLFVLLKNNKPVDESPEVSVEENSGYRVCLKVYKYSSGCDCPLNISYRTSSGLYVTKNIYDAYCFDLDATPRVFEDDDSEESDYKTIILTDVASEIRFNFTACGQMRVYDGTTTLEEDNYLKIFDGVRDNSGLFTAEVDCDTTFIIQGVH